MKKFFIVAMLLMFASVSWAVDIVQNEEIQVQYPWIIGTSGISVAQAVLTAFDDANVTAIATTKKILLTIPDGWGGVDLRIRIDGGNENDSNQIEMYYRSDQVSTLGAARTADYWNHLATLTVLQGTCLYSNSMYFIDTITDTNVVWIGVPRARNVANGIATYHFTTYGYKYFLFICPTITSNAVIYIDYKRW
jgi:hypothetical protein